MSTEATQAEKIAAQIKIIAGVLTSPEMIVKFKNLLPPEIPPARFIEIALNYLQQHARLFNANRESLYMAIQEAAMDGLYIDGKEAALNAYRKKGGGDQSFAEYVPMVDGIAKKLGQAGITIDTQLVYEEDFFEASMGDNPTITHKLPKLGTKRGLVVGAYAIVHLPNGHIRREIMDREALDKIREMTKSRNSNGEIVGPWVDHPGEMCRKTVFKRAQKRLPALDAKLEALLKRGEEPLEEPRQTLEADATALQGAPAGKPRALEAIAPSTPTPAAQKPVDNEFDDSDELL